MIEDDVAFSHSANWPQAQLVTAKMAQRTATPEASSPDRLYDLAAEVAGYMGMLPNSGVSTIYGLMQCIT
jgi:hypothetical protein